MVPKLCVWKVHPVGPVSLNINSIHLLLFRLWKAFWFQNLSIQAQAPRRGLPPQLQGNTIGRCRWQITLNKKTLPHQNQKTPGKLAPIKCLQLECSTQKCCMAGQCSEVFQYPINSRENGSERVAEVLPCVGYAKYSLEFSPTPFYWWENWGSERVKVSPHPSLHNQKVTALEFSPSSSRPVPKHWRWVINK